MSDIVHLWESLLAFEEKTLQKFIFRRMGTLHLVTLTSVSWRLGVQLQKHPKPVSTDHCSLAPAGSRSSREAHRGLLLDVPQGKVPAALLWASFPGEEREPGGEAGLQLRLLCPPALLWELCPPQSRPGERESGGGAGPRSPPQGCGSLAGNSPRSLLTVPFRILRGRDKTFKGGQRIRRSRPDMNLESLFQHIILTEHQAEESRRVMRQGQVAQPLGTSVSRSWVFGPEKGEGGEDYERSLQPGGKGS